MTRMRKDYGLIDSHIHFDLYNKIEQERILSECNKNNIFALISVSFHLKSCKENLQLSRQDRRIKPAFGYHPEQPIPSEDELECILSLMKENQNEMTAVGEVGLPYYLREENPSLDLAPYEELLEVFIRQAKDFNKPIILHAIYEDADIAVSLLEKSSIRKAHFHWFKGSANTLRRLQENTYYISVTPDVLYEKEIEDVVRHYPLELMMVETDGPWKFEGPFSGKMTHPRMIHKTIEKIAGVKREAVEDVYRVLLDNTQKFFSL